MTKQELMETYTAEQLAEMVINYSEACFQNRVFNSLNEKTQSPLKKPIEDNYKMQIKQKKPRYANLKRNAKNLKI